MSIITLYHGTPNEFVTPQYGYGEDKHDYGKGFYLTENIELAKEWAVCRPTETNGWVHKYELDISDLKILDFQKYDITLLIDGNGDEKAERLIRSLPSGIRVLYRGQPFNGSAEEIASHDCLMKGKKAEIPHRFYKREARRLFGDAVFDCAIDFTGKKNLFSMVASEMENTRFFTYRPRFVPVNRIQKELQEQQVR